MDPLVIVGVRRTGTSISHILLESGSVLTQDDCEKLLDMGAVFVTQGDDGAQAEVTIMRRGILTEGIHLRTVRNGVMSDNLTNIPEF